MADMNKELVEIKCFVYAPYIPINLTVEKVKNNLCVPIKSGVTFLNEVNIDMIKDIDLEALLK